MPSPADRCSPNDFARALDHGHALEPMGTWRASLPDMPQIAHDKCQRIHPALRPENMALRLCRRQFASKELWVSLWPWRA